jgi:hypothetical protein
MVSFELVGATCRSPVAGSETRPTKNLGRIVGRLSEPARDAPVNV